MQHYRCASRAPPNYNIERYGICFGHGCALRAPTNYNQKQVGNTSASARCASRAPPNYNNTGTVTETPVTGAPRAHQRITTSRKYASQFYSSWCASRAPTNYNSALKGRHTRYAGCASRAPTNYNFNCTGIKNVIWAVRLARTNELQQVLLGQKQVLSGCASRAPMNYNTGRPDNPYIEDGAPRVHQRITTSRSPATGRRRSRCASRAPMNYNSSENCTIYRLLRCASYAPTNYNVTGEPGSASESGAPRAHP